ncbi:MULTISPECIES: hypothetical protein [unclassified Duganella]|uniref:hypothetical protein n=1 Tax=unclassified Duganella TaxID=2636909 RepID=UPI000E355599|nr:MULTISPECIES: hypothetical protein [unclassified Duganella]RFP10770.1 hypothetical protein D0T23_22475 [Duganella sp. BJB475]RFP27203.1 hypothetical protein D0T21_24765 [Duganella sp. BJB476]
MHSISKSLFIAIGLAHGLATAANIPDVVMRLSDSYAASREEYARWFFAGFTHPVGGISTNLDLMRDAYTQGQSYWREHANERDQIFSGYGYQAVEADGVWSRGFEKSSFVPVNSQPGKWWMTSFGGVKWTELGTNHADAPSGQAQVHIVGYLSPRGGYGHLGMYEQEVLVTSFTLLHQGP